MADIEMQYYNGSSYVALYPLSNKSSSSFTCQGDLRIKGSSNYGNKINLGDGDYIHISEPTDDCMEIKAKKVNFVLSDTTTAQFTINGSNPFGSSSSSSLNYSRSNYSGTGRNSHKITLTSTAYLVVINSSLSNFSTNLKSNSFCVVIPQSLNSFGSFTAFEASQDIAYNCFFRETVSVATTGVTLSIPSSTAYIGMMYQILNSTNFKGSLYMSQVGALTNLNGTTYYYLAFRA